MADILVAEDTAPLRETLQAALTSDGHHVRLAIDGETALAEYRVQCPDLLLLDVMMPRLNGYEVCTEIRRVNGEVPIIFLSARGEEMEKVLGFGLGADDYIVKPFGFYELRARVAAALRHGQSRCRESSVFGFAGGTVYPERFLFVSAEGRSCRLTRYEVQLLRQFSAHQGDVLTRDALLDRIWGENYYGSTRTLDQHIARLRRKIGDGRRIHAVNRIGYVYQ